MYITSIRRHAVPVLQLAVLALLAGCGSPREKAAAYLEKAQTHYEAGDLIRSRLELRNTLQIEPRNAKALYLMALVDERDENYPSVLGNLQMAVDADPGFVDARVKLGNYYAAGRKVAETREQADAAMALAPNSPSVRLLNAWAYYVAGDREKALEEAREALTLDPTRRDAVTLLAGLHAEAGRFGDALAAVDKGIARAGKDGAENLRRVRVTLLVQAGQPGQAEKELKGLAADFPASPAYDLALARLLVSQDRAADAADTIRSLIARDPDNAEWRVQLAGLLVSQNKAGDAEESLLQAVRETPESSALRFALAGFYETARRPEDALKVYEALAASGPETAEGLAARNRIVALTATKDGKKARELLAGILADAPANVDALIYRAAFSFQDDNLQEAVADLRSALVRQPDSQRALLLLARTFVRSGEAPLAEDAYRKLLAVNPVSTPARTELAAVVGGRGDLKEAENILREALQFTPLDQPSSSSLVATLMSQGDLKGAEAEARRMVDLGDPSGQANYELGLAFQLQNKDKQAIAAYQQALAQNPLADQPLQDLVQLLSRTGKGAEAEAYLENHIKANPDHLTAKILLATVYRDSGRTELARQLFKQIIDAQPAATGAYIGLAGLYPPDSDERFGVLVQGHAKNPGDPQLGLALGTSQEKRGAYEEAIRVYETVIGAGGGNDFIVNNLAVLLLDVRKDEASYARALKLTAGFAEGARHPLNLAVLGWANYRNGKYAEAAQYLERAIAGSPGEIPQLRYYLGMAYLKAGNSAGAEHELQRAVDTATATGTRFTGLDDARAALKRLRAGSS
ncbi:MAG: tetratricopeptide repeat protein [Gammaproteobacteria bacterium]|nr:tetratricopeptide repeat protein [Gammaproteobacteria bacterium]